MSNTPKDKIGISIVIPVYAGAAYLHDLAAKINVLSTALKDLDVPLFLMEAILVLDEPKDDSSSITQDLAKQHNWLRVIELSRNFGQHNATVAGILHSSGDWVITLDEDLQHPPALIPEMMAKVAETQGDVLYVVPKTGSHKKSYRDFASRLSKKAISYLSGNQHVTDFSSFRVIRGQIARAAASVCTNQTYFDMTLLWFTQRVESTPRELNDPRFAESGQSGYSFWSLLSHAKRLLFSSDVHFFRLATIVGMGVFLMASGLLGWVLLSYYLTPDDVTTEGWASLMSVNLFFGGTLGILMALVLEFVRTSMFHSQGKPSFFVVDRSLDELIAEKSEQLVDLTETLEPGTTHPDG